MRGHMMRTFVGLALGTAWLTGCGLTADFSGLQGGKTDGGPADSSAPTAEASAPDTGDGSSEAAPPPPAEGGTSFCASLSPLPRFCEDFDEGNGVTSGWSQGDVYNAPDLLVDTSVHAPGSPPASFLSTMLAEDGYPASCRLDEQLPVNATHVYAEFEMLLPSGGGPYELFAIHEVPDDGSTFGIFYKESGGNLEVLVSARDDDGGVTQATYPLGAPPATWLHVVIDVDISDSATLNVFHDGSNVLSKTGLSTSTPTRQQLFVEAGFYSNNAATAHVNFDSIVLDWQ